jgi:hypothetical protein
MRAYMIRPLPFTLMPVPLVVGSRRSLIYYILPLIPLLSVPVLLKLIKSVINYYARLDLSDIKNVSVIAFL